ncbi:septation protein SepH [Corynebacterium sp. YIM 101645]|uniref:Septation protein SepH n=1 Tax=Corynebacterium lemuris TaxID=1859292 RepID=A0ABT2G2R2_9CORY|nr:septation protein SepH [Corynebacterium lemuris]MCS5480469.1 septation protein SepH [Corynebacterium lemuris]
MRELFLVPDESTSTSLVLRTADGDQFFLDVTQLDAAGQNLLSGLEPEIAAPSEPEPDPEPAPVVVAEPPRALPERDPLLTAPLTMRPREIQGRIRSGSSVEELAAEMRVAVSRVEAFAHPVLLERSRMAEMAKQAHPIREDGPAKLTLWEVLAAAFAARGHSVADTSWDAYREADGTWVARVTWTVGLSENEAEWSINAHPTSQTTAEARNPVAADLTDPDFVQPVRSLTSVGRGNRYEEDHDEDTSDGEQLTPEVPETEELEGEDFQAEEKAPPARRRRKAVTPHWEDVLLGVRANTKRPRN